MSDCRHGGRDVYRRVVVSICFTDESEIEYSIPINLMNREIDRIETSDGEVFTRKKED